jgi:homoserine O-acetyltransferase/O-succinyltransferase
VKKLAGRFDAHTYLTLTRAMDTHDIGRGRGHYENVLNRVEIPVLVIGITSDHLYPVAEQHELAELLPNGRYHEIDSRAGHDGFLLEFDQLNHHHQPFYYKNNLLSADYVTTYTL